MSRISRRAALAAITLALLLPALPGEAETSPTAVLQGFYDTLLATMKDGPKLGFAGRYSQLRPAIDAAFDLPLMARLSIGPQWQSLSPEQQQQLTASFQEYTYSTYASRFDDYSGERFEVTPQTSQTANGPVVQTRLVKAEGDPVSINYLMKQGNGSWRIMDVFLNGTVSELATRRAEFTSVLRRDGADGLVRLLTERVGQMKSGSKGG